MSIIIILMVISTTTFLNLNHPLSMTLNIIIQTLLICLLTGMISPTFWFSYILFLVFLGGMLVLFIYITSLASNELFKSSLKSYIMFTITPFFLLLLFIMEPQLMIYPLSTQDMHEILNVPLSFIDLMDPLLSLYNSPTYSTTLMLMFYLLLTLIIIVKITNIFKGPLRQSS